MTKITESRDKQGESPLLLTVACGLIHESRWWQLKDFFIFTPKFGEMIQFDQYFWDGLVQPPATSDISQVFVPFMAAYRAYGTWEIPKIFVRNHQTQPASRLNRFCWRALGHPYLASVDKHDPFTHLENQTCLVMLNGLTCSPLLKAKILGFSVGPLGEKNLHESCPAVTTVDLNPAKSDLKTGNWRNQWPHLISEHGLLGCARKLVNG